MKKLDKWVLHGADQKSKICHFVVSSSLTLCNNNEQFLSWIVNLTKSGFYATGDDQFSGGPRRSSKALPKAKFVLKKGYGHCLVVVLV